MLVAGVGARADSGHPLVHERRCVRHRPDDGHAGRQPRFDLGRRDRCRDGEDRLLRRYEPADLAEQRVEVLGLDRDHDEAGTGDGLRVGERRPDAVTSGHFADALLAPAGRDDLLRGAPAGAEQPGEERLADLPAAEDRDLSRCSHAPSV